MQEFHGAALAVDSSITRGLGATPKTKTAASEAVTPEGAVDMKPVSSGYADVNGIKLYHEIYGEGEPLVLIHGGLTDDRRDAGMGAAAREDAAR